MDVSDVHGAWGWAWSAPCEHVGARRCCGGGAACATAPTIWESSRLGALTDLLSAPGGGGQGVPLPRMLECSGRRLLRGPMTDVSPLARR